MCKHKQHSDVTVSRDGCFLSANGGVGGGRFDISVLNQEKGLICKFVTKWPCFQETSKHSWRVPALHSRNTLPPIAPQLTRDPCLMQKIVLSPSMSSLIVFFYLTIFIGFAGAFVKKKLLYFNCLTCSCSSVKHLKRNGRSIVLPPFLFPHKLAHKVLVNHTINTWCMPLQEIRTTLCA